MNKKFLLILTAMVLVLSLAACGGSEAAQTATDPSESTTESRPAETSAPIQSEQTEKFEELVLVNDENCIVKITAVDAQSIWGYALNVYLENKTDKELMFTVDDVSVNGYMCDPFWAVSVSPEKKTNDQISFMEEDFEKNGIETVTDITFTLSVYDSNDWLSDYLVEETFTIHP